MSTLVLEFEHVSAGFGNTEILTDINWQIFKGQHWAILGPMGAGKTVLAKTIFGDARLISGGINYARLDNPRSIQERKKSIALVTFNDTGRLFRPIESQHYYQQRYNAFDSEGHITALDYLDSGGFDPENNYHQKVINQMGIVNLLALDLIKLSSGQTRRLLLCRAILLNPQILIIDNPHIGLDATARTRFNELLDELADNFEHTIILSGHFQSFPQCISHQLILEKGKVTYHGSAVPMKKDSSSENPDVLSVLSELFLKSNQNLSFEQVLDFKDIHIQYENKVIIDHFTWQIKTGEKWVLLGDNGSGKSTILSLIYGDHPQAYCNKISLFGHQRGTGESIWEIKKRIGFTSPELHAYFDFDFRALDIVLSGIWDGFYVNKASEEEHRIAKLLFEYFELTSHMQTPFHALSTGMQRLLFFMRALIKVPPVLLLDEPFQGLDNDSVSKCQLLLNSILSDQYSLIFISHFKHEVPGIVNRIKKLNHPDI